MRSFILLLSLICFLIPEGHSQTIHNNDIVIGRTDSIYSKLLHEKRGIWVHLPDNSQGPIFQRQHYPVAYLLDGDAHFPSVMGMIQQLSEVNGNTVCPDMIVVGIPNTDRLRDLTPTHATASPYGDSNSVKASGGGELFTAFLEKELIPYIDSLYPTEPYRMLIGHSLGGLIVMNTLIHHPRLFNGYLAIDPSMWWDDQRLLKQAEISLPREHYPEKTLFLAVANTMPPGMDTTQVRKDTSGNTLHIRSILRLVDALKNSKGNGLRWDYKYYDGDNHGSVPLISEYDALRFMFSFYTFPLANKLFDSKVSADSAIATLSAHYKHLTRHMGYTVLPSEAYVNGMGYAFLQNKMPEKAFAFFKLNIENYPKSANVYDSMADYYSTMGDSPKAIEYYNKALALGGVPGTKMRLEKLKAKKP